ncbi:MAG: BON domain-containing protein, partial [Actinomycetota bacterium]|nr:BON domain-containing protein [Actinomycetota bacterium]
LSRQDLLSVFLRSDDEIAAEIADTLTRLLAEGPVQVAVTVREGMVTLTGRVPQAEQIAAVVKMTADTDGVVAVTSRLTAGPAGR